MATTQLKINILKIFQRVPFVSVSGVDVKRSIHHLCLVLRLKLEVDVDHVFRGQKHLADEPKKTPSSEVQGS